jgi:hypothetical protein
MSGEFRAPVDKLQALSKQASALLGRAATTAATTARPRSDHRPPPPPVAIYIMKSVSSALTTGTVRVLLCIWFTRARAAFVCSYLV